MPGDRHRRHAVKADLARSAGADEVILYAEQDFEPEVKRLTDGRGVDVVYDSVGKSTFAKGLNCLRPRGMMVLWGQASGAVEPLEPQLLNQKGSLYLTRPSLGAYIADRGELLWRAGDLFQWVADGRLEVRIDQILPLAQAAAAHHIWKRGRQQGKCCSSPSSFSWRHPLSLRAFAPSCESSKHKARRQRIHLRALPACRTLPMRIGLVIYGSLETLSGGYLYDRMLVRQLEESGHQ